MGLSSNCLIHFTGTKENLKGILTDNFRVKYCTERVHLGKVDVSMRIPMVSFCDIPLSQIKEHISSYGCYGIGLTKDWAIKNRLNPVLYVEPGSDLSAGLVAPVQWYANIEDPKMSDELRAVGESGINVMRYVKSYEGPLIRKGTVVQEKYRFSDEREWRYVPPMEDVTHDFHDGDEELPPEALDWVSQFRLEFEPNDIKYIIISDDDEIGEFINHLEFAKGAKYTHADVRRLTTRILTYDQIKHDI